MIGLMSSIIALLTVVVSVTWNIAHTNAVNMVQAEQIQNLNEYINQSNVHFNARLDRYEAKVDKAFSLSEKIYTLMEAKKHD